MGQSYYSQFVDSPDIRDHFDAIGYECDDPLAAAWLVWQSRNAPLGEKFRAWTHIIEAMPDVKIPIPNWSSSEDDSLHSFLLSYMKMLRRFYDEFNTQEEDDVYNYYTSACDFHLDNYGLFHDLPSCLNEAMQNDDDIILYKLNTRTGTRTRAYFNRDGIITDVASENDLFPDELDLTERFYMITIWHPFPCSFPTPFQTGALVYDNRNGKTICLTGDDIFKRYGAAVMNFTFCRDSEFSGLERALPYKSDYLRGKIDLDTLLRETCRISFEEAGKCLLNHL